MNVHTDLYPFMSLKSGCYQTQHGQSRQRTRQDSPLQPPVGLVIAEFKQVVALSPTKLSNEIYQTHTRCKSTFMISLEVQQYGGLVCTSSSRTSAVGSFQNSSLCHSYSSWLWCFPNWTTFYPSFFSFLFFCQQITCFKAWNPSGYDDGLLRNALSKEDCAWFAWIHMIQNLPYCVLPRCPSLPPFFSPFFSYFFFLEKHLYSKLNNNYLNTDMSTSCSLKPVNVPLYGKRDFWCHCIKIHGMER